MQIDKSAPLVSIKEIVIDAPVKAVWTAQTSIGTWPTWQKDISYAILNGELAKGTAFVWKANGVLIQSTLQEVIPYKVLGWSGDSFGMHAEHLWEFHEEGKKTRVVTSESLSGWLPSLLKIFSSTFLDKLLIQSLHSLKSYVEKKAS